MPEPDCFASEQYSMYGHVKQLALAEKEGIEAAGGSATLFQYVHMPHQQRDAGNGLILEKGSRDSPRGGSGQDARCPQG